MHHIQFTSAALLRGDFPQHTQKERIGCLTRNREHCAYMYTAMVYRPHYHQAVQVLAHSLFSAQALVQCMRYAAMPQMPRERCWPQAISASMHVHLNANLQPCLPKCSLAVISAML